jgi:NADH dehydrogenase
MSAALPRVLIIGGGFGGIAAAKALRSAPVEVTVVDRNNHHVFSPLLYQVATAALAPSDIAVPIRWLLRKQDNTRVLMGSVSDLAIDRRVATLEDGTQLPYDYVIVAAGSRHSYFGHNEWEPCAPGLKTLGDALQIRSRFLLAFERAEGCSNAADREAQQTIVIVGGGPTGVELAGILVSIVRKALWRDFRCIDTRQSRVILLEAGPRLVPAFKEELSRHALKDLQALGVDVRLNTPVTEVSPDSVVAGGVRIRAHTTFWAAGNLASPLSKHTGAPVDRGGHVRVEPDLSIPGHPEVFVIGDQATIAQGDGRPVPAVAQGAIQMGRTAAANIIRDLRRQERRPFRYFNKGDMAVIGRYRAIAQFGSVCVSGVAAWFLWLFIHIMYLAGFRNRISVLVQWGYAFATWQRGVRLIVSSSLPKND